MLPDPSDTKRVDLDYEKIKARLESDAEKPNVFSARFGQYQVRSAFQPIISLTHARVVGHEGLLRATDAAGNSVPPPVVLKDALDAGSILELDRLCRTLHVANGRHATNGWLFLNIHPESFSRAQQHSRTAFMGTLLDDQGVDPGMVVIEILEELIEDEAHFGNAVGLWRDLGCLVAIDDFGAGHSNFDRIWQTAPDIVKLDRRFAIQCEADPRARRMLPRIVTMLHEAGSLVLLEGIETLTQAMVALESDVDFAQGYYFARPAPEPLPIHHVMDTVTDLWDRFESESHNTFSHQREYIAPYEQAIIHAATQLSLGKSLGEACQAYLGLDASELCYLLDDHGMQIGSNEWGKGANTQVIKTYKPIAGINGARWSRRPYFRRAIQHVGLTQSTRPYLSTASGHLCVTLSIAFMVDGKHQVLCGDLRWA